jgi:tRNA A37 threonylcarbamoyladenosine dehydratase
MLNQFSRTELLFGKEGMARLAKARVAVSASAESVDTQ